MRNLIDEDGQSGCPATGECRTSRQPPYSEDISSAGRSLRAGSAGRAREGVDYHVPFGGRKASSYGPREQGRYAAEFYTTVKTAYAAP